MHVFLFPDLCVLVWFVWGFFGFFYGGGGLGGLFQMSEIDIHVCALIIPTDLSELF